MKARHEFDTDEEYQKYLRIYFAAMAIQGLFSNPSEVPLKTVREALGLPETAEYLYPEHWNRHQAICAANAADALLEELNRDKK